MRRGLTRRDEGVRTGLAEARGVAETSSTSGGGPSGTLGMTQTGDRTLPPTVVPGNGPRIRRSNKLGRVSPESALHTGDLGVLRIGHDVRGPQLLYQAAEAYRWRWLR